MSVSSLIRPINGASLVQPITSMVADTNGNIIGICQDDTAPKIYLSPNYQQITVEAMDGDNAPIDNQLLVPDGDGNYPDPTRVVVHPTMISANTDMTRGIIATYGLGGDPECLYPFLYNFNINGSFPNYTYTQMPFYNFSGGAMVGSGNGADGKLSIINSMAVSPDGNRRYISYTERTYQGSPQGVLLKYKPEAAYTNSGPDGSGPSGEGPGYFQTLSDDYQNIKKMVCANGDILYCYYTTSSDADTRILKVVNGVDPTEIADNLFTDLSAGVISGLACSSDATILYAIDSSTLYKYNPDATAGSKWSTITMTLETPSVGNLSEIKCDSTGTYIMISDTTYRSVYFSDDAGTTWQTDYPPILQSPPFYSPVSLSCPSPYRQYISYSNGNIGSLGTGVYERMSTTLNTQSADFFTGKPSPSQMLTNTDGSKIIMINSTNNFIYYSTTFGNSFTQLSMMSNTNFSKIAASSDFSKILVQMADNELNMVTLGTNSYTITPLTYADQTYIPSIDVPSLISVSSDGNMAIVQDVTDITGGSPVYQYNLWYSIQGVQSGNFLYLGPVNNNEIDVSSISISSGTEPYININTSGGNRTQYRYTGQPFAYSINSRILGSTVTSTPSVLPGPSNFIALSATAQVIFVNITAVAFAGTTGIYFSNDYGLTYNTSPTVATTLLSGDTVTGLTCNSTGTTLMILTNNGVYFVDIDTSTGTIGSLKFISAPITAIASNANGGRQYFFNSTTGLTTRNATAAATPCFLEGTKILCLVGDVETYLSVQNLKEGTLVKTASGFKKVNKIGKSHIQNPGHSGRTMDRLYVCRKENFPELTEDLFITGYHSILVDELTQEQTEKSMEINRRIFEADGKKCLMAALSEKAEPWTQEGTFTIWHLSLEDEDEQTKFGVYSNGLLTETCSMDYMTASKLENKPVSLTPKNFNKSSL